MKPAFVLAIDHRNSLRRWYLKLTGATCPDGKALRAAKVLVADGLLTAITKPEFADQPMLLIDEEYGTDATVRIRAAGTDVRVAIPAERSGQPEFGFEYGAEFGAHIAATGPDVVKALVRYNPSGDKKRNTRS